MSHFLQIADRIKRLSAENYNIVEGIVSHISLPRKKRILTNIGLTDCKLLKQKLNNRYKEEVNTAIEMNMKSL